MEKEQTHLSEHHDIKPNPKCFVQRSLFHSVHCVVLCIPDQKRANMITQKNKKQGGLLLQRSLLH